LKKRSQSLPQLQNPNHHFFVSFGRLYKNLKHNEVEVWRKSRPL
jgi:hypothetical protein